MSKHLLLTLGHNSSAIIVEDNKLVEGYEYERITGVKSDSRFPADLVRMLLKRHSVESVFATHWEPTGNLYKMGSKYWNVQDLLGLKTYSNNDRLTHHDTHMRAALNYAGPKFPKANSIGLVIDGFGTCGEHISIYELTRTGPELIRRYFGYETSLGLWYQYATAFMGMQMHQDEYKILGYEVLCSAEDIATLQPVADRTAEHWLEKLESPMIYSKGDPLFDLSALEHTRKWVFDHLNRVCTETGIARNNRAAVGFYVQRVLEQVVLGLLNEYNYQNLLVSGGVFHNVKLNKLLIDEVDGLFCAHPLCGDQGNALGLYSMHNDQFEFPTTMCWGLRELKDVGHVKNLHVVDQSTAFEMVAQKLKTVGYVNLVKGPMEFGPRAMCNTSTLAIPLQAHVKAINTANNRNTVMPMAPVMTAAMYKELFERTRNVWKSYEHMIVAMEYKEYPPDHLLGVAHDYNWPKKHQTGRPQVVTKESDPFMTKLLELFGHPLINTSFNYHGQPIAYDMPSIIDNHLKQLARDDSFHTIVIATEA